MRNKLMFLLAVLAVVGGSFGNVNAQSVDGTTIINLDHYSETTYGNVNSLESVYSIVKNDFGLNPVDEFGDLLPWEIVAVLGVNQTFYSEGNVSFQPLTEGVYTVWVRVTNNSQAGTYSGVTGVTLYVDDPIEVMTGHDYINNPYINELDNTVNLYLGDTYTNTDINNAFENLVNTSLSDDEFVSMLDYSTHVHADQEIITNNIIDSSNIVFMKDTMIISRTYEFYQDETMLPTETSGQGDEMYTGPFAQDEFLSDPILQDYVASDNAGDVVVLADEMLVDNTNTHLLGRVTYNVIINASDLVVTPPTVEPIINNISPTNTVEPQTPNETLTKTGDENYFIYVTSLLAVVYLAKRLLNTK